MPGEKFGVSGSAENDDKISFYIEGANAVSGDSVYSDGITSIYEFTEDGETYQYITGENMEQVHLSQKTLQQETKLHDLLYM